MGIMGFAFLKANHLGANLKACLLGVKIWKVKKY